MSLVRFFWKIFYDENRNGKILKGLEESKLTSTTILYLPNTDVIILHLDDILEVVPVFFGDEPAAPRVEDLQFVVPGKEVA